LLEAKQRHAKNCRKAGVLCSVQFRKQEPALLKLAQQLAAGPPTSLLHGWQQPPAALFLNKQDKLQPHIRDVALQQLGQQLGGIAQFDAVFQGAAMRGEGVDELREYFVSKVGAICLRQSCVAADRPKAMAWHCDML
jgi:GTPase Era involved in 16S rRNA processing